MTDPSLGGEDRYSADAALRQAREWHDLVRARGIQGVELVLPGKPLGDGRWRFGYYHAANNVVRYLYTPGLDAWLEHDENPDFTPRALWDGASDTEPKAEDWLDVPADTSAVLDPVENPELAAILARFLRDPASASRPDPEGTP